MSFNTDNPNTRWKRSYSDRFSTKYDFITLQLDQRDIYEYTIKIANHPTPLEIGGTATCPEKEFKKIKFTSGWVIIYEFKQEIITFVNFYLDK